jgi:hypothetical protein
VLSASADDFSRAAVHYLALSGMPNGWRTDSATLSGMCLSWSSFVGPETILALAQRVHSNLTEAAPGEDDL